MKGLVTLIGGAALFDLWAWRRGDETISAAFKRFRDDPIGRLVSGAVIGALALHLFEESHPCGILCPGCTVG